MCSNSTMQLSPNNKVAILWWTTDRNWRGSPCVTTSRCFRWEVQWRRTKRSTFLYSASVAVWHISTAVHNSYMKQNLQYLTSKPDLKYAINSYAISISCLAPNVLPSFLGCQFYCFTFSVIQGSKLWHARRDSKASLTASNDICNHAPPSLQSNMVRHDPYGCDNWVKRCPAVCFHSQPNINPFTTNPVKALHFANTGLTYRF